MRPNRRELLWGTAALLGAPRVSFALGAAPAKHLIVVYAEGGWDVTYCMDPKLSCVAPDGGACTIEGPEFDEDANNPDDREAVQTFGSIPIMVNDVKRPTVRTFFDRWSSRAHVINGIWTGSIAHIPCRYRMLTGLQDGKHPDMATVAGYVHGVALPLGAVDLSGWSILGDLAASAGRIGNQSQIVGILDPTAQFQTPAGTPYDFPLFGMDPTDEAAVEAWVRGRADRLRARFSDGDGRNNRAIDDLLSSVDRGTRFRAQSVEILGSLQIGTRAGFLEQVGIAVDLVEAGLCHTVTIDSREAWDTHEGNDAQHANFDRLFFGLGSLLEDLEARGLLDQVVVAVVSEMTRTPLRNSSAGKDHWGHTSALLLGAVRGGVASGATSHLLESMPIDLATGVPNASGDLHKYDNFCAGLLDLVGVDPGAWLPGVVPFRGAHPS